MRVIDRIKRIAGQDIPFTEVEKHLAEEYVILAKRVEAIAGVARRALEGPDSRMMNRIRSIEQLANSAFYRDWDK